MLSVWAVASICHEANRALCAANGDMTQQPWETAPEWQQKSAAEGVRFHVANPDATPADSHQKWLDGKRADGWAYGEDKDAERKLHPCMVPYEKLPPEQQSKDHLFRNIVHALAPFMQPEAA